MLNIPVMLDPGAYIPTKAHKEDAGFDIYAPCDIWVMGKDSNFVDTGVHMLIPEGYVGMIKSKSGLNKNYGINVEGVVDAGYQGTIGLKIYNLDHRPYQIKKGDKVTQIVILPIPEVELYLAESFDETARGANGFGSTGR